MTTTTFGNVIRAVALGDAWGDPVEFRRIADITRNNVRGPEIPDRLRITDDTQMSLFLADALDAAGPDGSMQTTKDEIMDAFLGYYKDPDTGSRAPGNTVMGSLGKLSRRREDRDWKLATNPGSDGSGTVMRTSPCAFLAEDRWVGVTAFAAAVTHGAANAVAAAILDVKLLREIMAGDLHRGGYVERALTLAADAKAYGLTNTGEWLEGYPVDLEAGFVELARLLAEALRVLPDLRAQPWVIENDPSMCKFFSVGSQGAGWRAHHTLIVALLALDMFPDDDMSALRRSVVTTGDSDTIGAVAGALLGAGGFTYSDEIFERLEPRYKTWITEEADHYVFVNAPASKRGFWTRVRDLVSS